MARKPSPWWWAAERGWYVNLDGKRHRLGDHPSHASKPKKGKTGWNAPMEIDAAFRALASGQPKVPAGQSAEYLAVILQEFISWCKENRAVRTTERYFEFLDSFERRYHGLKVADLTPQHVTAWLREQPGWKNTTKRNAITAIQRALNWGVKNLSLPRNPIRGMEKPEAERRTEVVSPVVFGEVLTHASGPFRDLLIVSYDSGSRPQEVKKLEARHLQLDKHRAVLPAEEAKGKKAARTIYFPTERSMEIVRRLAIEHAVGPIFLNKRGNPWTGFAVKCAFARMDEKLGRRVTHYSLRHSFVTRQLVAGVDSHVVAALAGHKDTTMIHRVYSHVADDHTYMLEQAKKGVNPGSGA